MMHIIHLTVPKQASPPLPLWKRCARDFYNGLGKPLFWVLALEEIFCVLGLTGVFT